jgi:hypothetical protein
MYKFRNVGEKKGQSKKGLEKKKGREEEINQLPRESQAVR